mgnify:CR=1 FL=1
MGGRLQGSLQFRDGLIAVCWVVCRATGYHLIIYMGAWEGLENLADGIDIGGDIYLAIIELLRGGITVCATHRIGIGISIAESKVCQFEFLANTGDENVFGLQV